MCLRLTQADTSGAPLSGGAPTYPPPIVPGVYCTVMPHFSLLSPMPGLPWHLLPIWRLIFWRIQRLKAWFRAAGGPGSQMAWGLMWNGRVVIIRASDDLSVQPSCCFRALVSSRLRLALVESETPYPRRI